LKNLKDESLPGKFIWKIEREGQSKQFDVGIKKVRENGNENVVFTLINPAERENGPLISNDTEKFREIVYELIGEHNFVPVSDIPMMLKETLQVVGLFLKADRICVCTIESDKNLITKLSEWFDPGIHTFGKGPVTMNTEQMHWTLDKLSRDGMLVVNNINDLPEEAVRERRNMEKWKVRSFIILPIKLEGGETGFIEADYVKKEKVWTDNDINNLTFVAGAIATMIKRYRKETGLLEKEALYTSLFAYANDSILVFKNGRCIDCSDKALELFGCERHDLIGIKGEDLAYDLKQAKKIIEDVKKDFQRSRKKYK